MNRAEREAQELEAVFKAIAHHARRHILILIEAAGGRLSAGYIAERFAHSWPTTTRHLKVLETSGLLTCEPEGRERFYSINKDLMFRVGQGWFNHFNKENQL